MNKFWEFKALGNAGELFLYGEISDTSWWGDEITPAQFQKELAALGDISTLDVYINSPGGDIFAGFSLYNILFQSTPPVRGATPGMGPAGYLGVISIHAPRAGGDP